MTKIPMPAPRTHGAEPGHYPKNCSWPDEVKALWDQIAATWDISDPAGRDLLALACSARSEMTAAEALIAKHGYLVPGQAGVLKTNPAHEVLSRARSSYLRAMQQLHLGDEPARPVGRPSQNFWGPR